jgi:hypothetical protein
MMSLQAYDICRETLKTVKNRADMFTIITALAHALPATPLLAELPAKPFFHYVLTLQRNTRIFSLKLQQTDDEMFTKHRLEVSVLFQGVIFHVTQPWMEGNTTLKAKLLHFTNFFFFLGAVRVTLTQISLKASNHYWIFKQKNFNKSMIFKIPITCNHVLCLHYATQHAHLSPF